MRAGNRALVVVLVLSMTSSGLAVAFMAGSGGNGDSEVETESAYDPTSYVHATIGEPQYLDPAVDYEEAGGEVIQNVYETLIWYDRESAVNLKPMLATEVPTFANGGISSDGLNYTFILRPGVKFHDGQTMTAVDVEYSFERVLRIHDPDGPSWMLEQVTTDYIQYYVGWRLADFKSQSYCPSWLLSAIGGTLDSYIITELDVQNVSEAAIVGIDSDTVSIHLTHPYPAFISILAYNVMSVVSKAFVEAHGGVVNGEHNDYMDTHACGTGPYTLLNWDVGYAVNLTRFDDYWGTKPPIRDVSIVKINDANTRVDMLKNGTADSAYLTTSEESNFTGDLNVTITKGIPTFSMDFMGFNQRINTTAAAVYGSTVPTGFFADRTVRKAFVHLMNCPLFINICMNGNGIQPNGPIPKGMYYHNASFPKYSYSLTMVRDYLQNATNPATGHSWWVDGFTIAFIYNVGNVYRETSCLLLKLALETMNTFPGTHGTFSATINALDWPTYYAEYRRVPSSLPVFFFGWAPDYADPDDYVNPFLYSHGSLAARMHYSNATMDSLVMSASAELNPVTRQSLYDQICWLCYDDAPYIWEAQLNVFHVQRSWVQGYYSNPMYSGLYYAALSKVIFDSAPIFVAAMPSTVYVESGVIHNFTIMISDVDNDDVNVTWDWGDGSPPSDNVTYDVLSGVLVKQSHTWTIPPVPGYGDYYTQFNMTVILDDGEGLTATRNCTIMVYVPYNAPPTIGLSLSKTTVSPNESLVIQANASDPEGDPLTWTYSISNGTATEVIWVNLTASATPSALVWNNLSTCLSEEGDYWITVEVSDALPPNQIFPHNVSQSIALRVIQNSAPITWGSILMTPSLPVIDMAIGEVTVEFSIEALDVDGDVVSANWTLGEDVPPVTNVSAGGLMVHAFNQTRVFNKTGVYNITVVVSDGYPGHEVILMSALTVTSNNMPPDCLDIFIAYSQLVSSLPGEVINIAVTFTDPEEDVISGTLDFGDGSEPMNFTVGNYSGGTVTLGINHSYALVGTYNLTITYSDGKIGMGDHTKIAEDAVLVSDTLIPEFSPTLLPLICIGMAIMLSLFKRGRHRFAN